LNENEDEKITEETSSINEPTSINEKSIVEIGGEKFEFAAKTTTLFCQHRCGHLLITATTPLQHKHKKPTNFNSLSRSLCIFFPFP
jgi:hypothetical protein